MTKNIIGVVLMLLATSIISAQAQTKYEQIAFEHFFDNIFKEKYKNVSSLEFNGCTTDELSNFTLFKNCFNLDKEMVAALDKKAYGNTFPNKNINTNVIGYITFKKRKVKSKMKIYLYQANQTKDYYYIILGIVKPKHFYATFYYELDKLGKVTRWCESEMII